VFNWDPVGRRGRGRPSKNWPETICEDLRGLGLTWEYSFDTAEDRNGWMEEMCCPM